MTDHQTNEVRIRLDEDDFKRLIEGKAVLKHEGETVVSIILADIGFDRMKIIEKAEKDGI